MKIRQICCIGAGFVGGPTMSVIAHECPNLKVIVVDSNSDKIKSWNSKSLDNLPVYEPGLKEIIKKTRNKNLFFSHNIDEAILNSDIIFMAVNTPTKTSGKGKGFAADLTNVVECTKKIALVAKSSKIIVEKSTLPVKTAEKIKEILTLYNKKTNFDVVSNPEFLAEGTAIENLYKSDRVLIGGENTISGKKAVDAIVSIYKKWIPENKILKTNIWSSELAKLASNAMLAQRISSINSLSALCEKTGASIQEISKAIGMDSRIGPEFLEASVGFGGSCFKKDILNLVYLARFYGLNEVADYWHGVVKINDYQMKRFTKKIQNKLKNINDKTISILGWAFKKQTNDSRESPSIYVSKNLIESGANLKIYDPMVPHHKIISDLQNLFVISGYNKKQVKKLLEKISITKSLEESLIKSSAVVIITNWDEFLNFNWRNYHLTTNPKPVIFDGRNVIKTSRFDNMYSLGN